VNYKVHYDLSWFRPLQGGNSPMSSWLQWGEKRALEVHVVKGEMISYPLPEG
jgi:hypothetical protein